MKFSKIVSAVSALTLAASAFAGLATTASAASESISYSYTVDGTSASSTLTVGVSGCGVSADYTDANSVTKTPFGVKGGGGSGNRTATTSLAETVSAAIVEVNAYVFLQAGNNNNSSTYLYLTDEDGNNLLTITNAGNNSDTIAVAGSADTEAQSTTALMTRRADSTLGNGSSSYYNTAWIALDATFNFTAHTGTVTLGTEEFTVAIADTAAGVNGFAMQAGRGYGAVLLSELAITTKDSPADTLTINYVDESNNKLADSYPINVSTMSIGDDYTYTYSKYLVKDGNLYKTTAEKTQVTTQLTSKQSVDVVYALESKGDYTFTEVDGAYVTRAAYESNGSAGSTGGSTGITVFTAEKSGVYDVIVNGYGGSSNRTITLQKVAADKTTTDISEATTLSIYNYGTDITATGIELAAGESIKASGSASSSYVDYAIINRTGDISYAITATSTESATVTVDKTAAAEGDTVTVTATAANGYENPVITVTTASGTAVIVTDGTFTMPAEAVTVTATATAAETTDPEYKAVNVGTYEGNTAEGTDDGTDATVFVVDIEPAGTTVNVSKFTVTSGGTSKEYTTGTGTDGTMTTLPTITGGSDYTFGVIVDNLSDSAAVLTLTLE